MKISQTTLISLLLGLVLIFAYSHTISYPFAFDDLYHIVDNISLRISSFTLQELTNAVANGYDSRPVATLSLAANYLAGQYNPAGYRFSNLIIHLVNGLLVFSLLTKTCLLSQKECSEKSLAPLFGTLLWFAHPIQIQSVTYIIQRMTSLATLFYLSSLLLFIKARTAERGSIKSIYYTLCVICGLLAMGSKEIAITLPISILLYNAYFLKKDSLSSLKLTITTLLLFSTTIVFFFLVTEISPIHLIQQSYATRNFTLIERLLTEPRVILFYISLLFFPYYTRFNLDHTFSLSSGFFQPPQTIIAIAVLFLLFLSAIIARRKNTILSFSIIWFLLNLVLESSFIGLEIIFEHRVYLPSIFVFFAFSLILERYIANKKLLITGLSCLVLMLTFFSYQRNLVWATPLSLWQDVCLKSPLKSRPQGYLGHAYYKSGDLPNAISHLKKAIELDPANLSASNTLGVIMSEQGNSKMAIQILKNNLSITPDDPNSLYNLAGILYKEGKVDEALGLYRQLVKQHPDMVQAYCDLAGILIKNAPEKATTLLEQASLIDKNNPQLHKRIGDIYFLNNKFEKAKRHYISSLYLEYEQPEVHNALGGIYFNEGNLKEAQNNFLTAVKQNPLFDEAKRNLAITALKLKQETTNNTIFSPNDAK